MKTSLLIATLGIIIAANGYARTWTEAGSGRTVEGEFRKLNGDTVEVLRPNGTVLKLPLAKLSEEDQKFVADQGAASASEGEGERPKVTHKKGDKLKEGDIIDLVARPVKGEKVDLAAMKGKVVLLDFWATWCGPCIAAMPGLAALAREHAAEVEVIAINLDDAAEARAIFDRSGYQMRLVADDGTISQRYGVTTIPHTVVIDRAGIVRSVHRGGGKAAEHEVERMLDAEIAK